MTTTVVQKVNSPKSTVTSSMKSALKKKEKITIQAIITTVDPNTTIHVSTVQLRAFVSDSQ